MTGEELAYLAARVLTCGIWVAAGLHKATHYRANIAEMGHLGVPSPSLVLPLVLVLEMVGALLLVVDEYVWAVCLAWLDLPRAGELAVSLQVHGEERRDRLSAIRNGLEERVDRRRPARADSARCEQARVAISGRLTLGWV